MNENDTWENSCIAVNKDSLRELKICYENALMNKQDCFTFQNQEINVKYAEQLIKAFEKELSEMEKEEC